MFEIIKTFATVKIKADIMIHEIARKVFAAMLMLAPLTALPVAEVVSEKED